MQRREFIAFLGGMAVTATRGALAQTPKIYRLGTLTVGPPIPATAGTGAILINSLAKRGYTLGQNLAYEALRQIKRVVKFWREYSVVISADD